jgi:hypothetical protein
MGGDDELDDDGDDMTRSEERNSDEDSKPL